MASFMVVGDWGCSTNCPEFAAADTDQLSVSQTVRANLVAAISQSGNVPHFHEMTLVPEMTWALQRHL